MNCKPLAVLFLLFLVASCLLFSCSQPQSSVLAITHVTVIDMTGAPALADQTVVINKQRIVATGAARTIAVPSGAQTIDGTGKFLIPGLADMHVHLTGAGEPGGSREFILPLLVANGITTVRDMGGYADSLGSLQKEIASGTRLGPQIFFTGAYLDGDPPGYQPSVVVRSAQDAPGAVERVLAQGAGFLKVQSRLSREAYFAIAKEARRRGVPFVGHVPDQVSALEASEAGQASVEHLTGILLACSAKEGELRRQQFLPEPARVTPEKQLERSRAWQRELLDTYSSDQANDLFRTFARNGTWQVPTFPIIVHFGFATPRENVQGDPRMIYIPVALRKIWAAGFRARVENRTDADFRLREEIVKESLQAAGAMQASGVRLMAGTDAAAPGVFPGSSLHEDLAYFFKAGLKPMEALQAATRNPADFLGKLDTQGTIEKGKFADLVLLDANPLEDIRNTQKIRAVILRGKLLDRAALDALLAGVEEYAKKN